MSSTITTRLDEHDEDRQDPERRRVAIASPEGERSDALALRDAAQTPHPELGWSGQGSAAGLGGRRAAGRGAAPRRRSLAAAGCSAS